MEIGHINRGQYNDMNSHGEAKGSVKSWLLVTAVVIWAVFTISLIGWWYIFSQRQIAKLSVAGGALAEELIRNQKMLMWEGATLLVSLLLGAFALGYLVMRDRQHSKQVMQFFLTFTHELKTPIASLRLYAETLTENLRGKENSELGRELMKEADRLSLQLDNSLALSHIKEENLYLEELSLLDIIRPLHEEFLGLTIQCPVDVKVRGDSQALTVIFRNLFKNSLIHGKATTVTVRCDYLSEHQVRVDVIDDGQGLQGDRTVLGSKFQRLYRGSGSGIGLYLVKKLTNKMFGDVTFPETVTGFVVQLTFPSATSTEKSVL